MNTNTEPVEHSAVERLTEIARWANVWLWIGGGPEMDVRDDLNSILSELERLQADNGRLRGALTQISVGPAFVTTDLAAWAEYTTESARQALSVEGGG